MTDEKKAENLREYFRIHYLPPDAPVFKRGDHKLTVLDVSEGGLRFVPKPEMHFSEEEQVSGDVVFPLGRGVFSVKGTVIRASPNEVALKLLDNARIPLSTIMEEQRYFIAHGKRSALIKSSLSR